MSTQAMFAAGTKVMVNIPNEGWVRAIVRGDYKLYPSGVICYTVTRYGCKGVTPKTNKFGVTEYNIKER